MYTEYIFSNKDYEIALKSIKASLFDIVSREEANISSLREKAFNEDYGNAQESLQELFVRQDSCLRNILTISEQLSESLKKVDACSRDLKIIEKKAMEQFVAYVNENAQALTMTDSQEAPIEEQAQYEAPPVAEPIYEEPAAIAAVEEPIMGDVDPSLTNDSTEGGEEDVLMTYDDSLSTVTDEQTETTADATGEEDVLMTYDDSLSTVTDEQAETAADATGEEDVLMTYDDSLSTVTDEQAETAADATGEEDVLMTYDDSISTVTDEGADESQTTSDPVLTIDTPVSDSSEDVLMTYDDSTSTVTDESTDESQAVSDPVLTIDTPVSDSSEDVLMTYDDSTSTVTDEAADESKATSDPVLTIDTPVSDSSEDVLMTYDDSTSTVTDEAADESKATSDPVLTIEADDSNGSDEIIENDELLNSGDNLDNNAINEGPLAIPASPEEVMMATQEKRIKFNKISDDPAKVIMVSKKQFDKLTESLLRQENALKDTGIFKEYDAIQENNQQEIEALMQKANELYSAGKVSEAQEIFDQISILNNNS